MAIFLSHLKQKGQLDQLHVTVCNVGSRKISAEDDYASRGWHIFAPHLSIYGFDADADACELANAELESRQVDWQEKHIPLALGQTVGESILYVTKHPMCTSLYPPNESFATRFDGLSEVMGLDFTLEIETTTLDEFCGQEGIQAIDFLQIDVQGADLDVLKGAAEQVKQHVMAIQIEVEFSPLYSNQPLFADIDSYLRQQQYTLFDVLTARRIRRKSPIIAEAHPGQMLWGDAFYFYDLLRDDLALSRTQSPDRLLKLACIADVMNFSDYALEILEYLTITYGNQPQYQSQYNVADAIVEGLAAVADFNSQELAALEVIQNIQPYISQEIQQKFLN
jgi:FkbM family methyltransferase